uniref:Small ribosomal subunit protein uS17 n=1 Tax=Xenopus tropicalis TaxID=8364 RepID=A0A803JRG7_XENTR
FSAPGRSGDGAGGNRAAGGRVRGPGCRCVHGLWAPYRPVGLSCYRARAGTIPTERAYQKQPTIFQNKKRVLQGETGKEKLPRYYRNVGLGFKTPREAIDGTYIDKKCPFTGNVSIRGRILSGVVTKMKMQRTIVIRRDYLHYIRKYNRFEKRHKNMSVHLSPCFRDVQIGDIVTVGECRPLSKTVRFNVLKVTKAAGTKKQFQKF